MIVIITKGLLSNTSAFNIKAYIQLISHTNSTVHLN